MTQWERDAKRATELSSELDDAAADADPIALTLAYALNARMARMVLQKLKPELWARYCEAETKLLAEADEAMAEEGFHHVTN